MIISILVMPGFLLPLTFCAVIWLIAVMMLPLQNYTDVDDKMINKAAELKISVDEVAERFISAYEEDTAALGILPADYHPRATRHIPRS